MVDIKQFDRVRPNAFSEFELLVKNKWMAYYEHKLLIDDYTLEYLKWCLRLLNRQQDYSIGAYDENELVGFIGAMPRKIRYNGQDYDANLSSFLTIGKNFGGDLSERESLTEEERERRSNLRRQVQKGLFDFYVNRFHTINPDGLTVYFVDRPEKRKLGINYSCDLLDDYLQTRSDIERIVEIPVHLGRAVFDHKRVRKYAHWKDKRIIELDVPRQEGIVVRDYRQEDLDACHKLVDTLSNSVDFARVWSIDELQWQLSQEPAHTLVLEYEGKIIGFVNYHDKVYLSPTPESKKAKAGNPELQLEYVTLKCAFIDSICFSGRATEEQKQALINTFFNRIIHHNNSVPKDQKKGTAYDFASIPDFGLTEDVVKAFKQAGANMDDCYTFYMGIIRSKNGPNIELTKDSKVYMDVK